MKVNRVVLLILSVLVLVTSGCMNISTRLQPEDTSVNKVLYGEDCVPIILGIGFGTATIENAMADGHVIGNQETKRAVTKIRKVEYTESVAFIGGGRCINVLGE